MATRSLGIHRSQRTVRARVACLRWEHQLSRRGPSARKIWRTWPRCSRVSGTRGTAGAWLSVRAAAASPSGGSPEETVGASRTKWHGLRSRWASWLRWAASLSAGARAGQGRATSPRVARVACFAIEMPERTTWSGCCHASSSAQNLGARASRYPSCDRPSNLPASTARWPSRVGRPQDPRPVRPTRSLAVKVPLRAPDFIVSPARNRAE